MHSRLQLNVFLFLRDASRIDRIDGEEIALPAQEAANLSRRGVVDLVAAEEPIGRNAVANDIKLRARCRPPTDLGHTSIVGFCRAARHRDSRNLLRSGSRALTEDAQAA